MPYFPLSAACAACFAPSLFLLTSRRKQPRRRGIGLTGLLAGVMALSQVPGASAQTNAPAKPALPPATTRAVLNGLQDAFADLADRLEPAVVTLYSVKTIHPAIEREGRNSDTPGAGAGFPRRRVTGTGSGVLISADGWVLTNDHVVGGADRVTVKLHDGREFTGEVRRDRRSDLALVKISSPSAVSRRRHLATRTN